MDYDSYILETPEDEEERLIGASIRKQKRQEYLVDLYDSYREREVEHGEGN